MSKQLVFIFFGLLISMLLTMPAIAQHKGISFQAIVKDPDGHRPSATGLTVRLQVLDPVSNCVLREEEHSGVNVTDGYINLVVGGPTAVTPVGTNPSPIVSMTAAMDNSKTINGFNCTYNPQPQHSRKLRISAMIPRQSGGIDSVVADFNMRAVAYAINSETLDGKAATDLINVNNAKSVTQTNIESIFDRFTKLDALLNNTNSGGTTLGVNISGNAVTATSATTATTATNVSGVVAIANGGTGASSASGVRTNLGLGSLATMAPTGTASSSTYLRGDGSWATVSGGSGTVTLAGDVTGSDSATVVEKIRGNLVASGTPTDGLMTWNSSLTRWEAVNPPTCTAAKALRWSAVSDSFTCEDITIAKAQISDFPTLGNLAAKGSVDLSSTEATGILSVDKGGTGLNGLLPANSILVMKACPTGWTDLAAVSGPSRTCDGVNCRVCQSPATASAIPASSSVLMHSCPAGWASLGAIAPSHQSDGMPAGANICQSPAQDSVIPSGVQVWSGGGACPTGWTFLNDVGSPNATCNGVICKVCESPGGMSHAKALLGGNGGTVSAGSNVVIRAGRGGSTSGPGGGVNISSGQASDGNGGSISIGAQSASTSTATARTGGGISLTSGAGAGGGAGGGITLQAGSDGAGNYTAMTLQASGGNVGVGTSTADAKLDVRGSSGATLKIVDGNQGAGKVLTSNASGVASWADPAAPGGGVVISTKCAWTIFQSNGTAACAPPACPTGTTNIATNHVIQTADYGTTATQQGGYSENLCESDSYVKVIYRKCMWTSYHGGYTAGTCTPPSCPTGWTDLGASNNTVTSHHYPNYTSVLSGNQERICVK